MAIKDFVKMNDAGDVDIQLAKPLVIDGVSITALRMREPLIADQMAAQDLSDKASEIEFIMFGMLCSVPHTVFKPMTQRDYRRMQYAYGLFVD